MRALIIEDDPGIRDFLVKGLREALFAVDSAVDGVQGAEFLRSTEFDIVLLDLMLPGKDGFRVLSEFRSAGKSTPVICLTARDAVADRVRGLDLGADDYLSKPFSFAELLARIRALLRRGPTLSSSPLQVADLRIDLLTRSVTRAGQKIELTAREFALLEYLARNAGIVLSRTMLLDHVWDLNRDAFTNVVDVHINRIRKKVDFGFERPLIQTVRGVGYVLRDQEA